LLVKALDGQSFGENDLVKDVSLPEVFIRVSSIAN